MTRKEHGDAEMISSAEKRAAITSHLAQVAEERPVAQIAEAVGLSRSAAGQILAKMADNKLLKVRKEGTAKLYSIKPGVAIDGTVEVVERKKPGRKPKRADDAQSIEFVIAGMVVVLSKVNGRVRVEISNES